MITKHIKTAVTKWMETTLTIELSTPSDVDNINNKTTKSDEDNINNKTIYKTR